MRKWALAIVMAGIPGLFPLAGSAQQELDPASIEAVLNLLTDPRASAAEIGDQATACVRPLGSDAPEHAPVIFDVAFGPEGLPQPPVLVAPTEEMAERIHMRQLIRAEEALFDCAPLTVGGGPATDVTFRFLAEGDRIEVWDDEAAFGDMPSQDETDPAAAAESALGLSRSDRREIQVRLRLAGFDPGGADGIFGPRTRSALREWQQASDLPASGYLDRGQIDTLAAATESAYAQWHRSNDAPPPTSRGRSGYRGSDGCLRYSDGRIVPSQSLTCDVKGLLQGF